MTAFFNLPKVQIFEITCLWIDTESLCLLDTAVTSSAVRPFFLQNMTRLGATTDLQDNSLIRNYQFRNWVLIRGLHPLVWCNLFGYSKKPKLDRIESYIFLPARSHGEFINATVLNECAHVKKIEILTSQLTEMTIRHVFYKMKEYTQITLNDDDILRKYVSNDFLGLLENFENCHTLIVNTSIMSPTSWVHFIVHNKLPSFKKMIFALDQHKRKFKVDLCLETKTMHIVSDGYEKRENKMLYEALSVVGSYNMDLHITIYVRRYEFYTEKKCGRTVNLDKAAKFLKRGIQVSYMVNKVLSHGVEVKFSDVLGKNAKFLRVQLLLIKGRER